MATTCPKRDSAKGSHRRRDPPGRRRPAPSPRRPEGRDVLTDLNALAHAGRPLTADFLAESLRWNLDRVSDAIERAWAYPHLAGPYALRRTVPSHHTQPAPGRPH